MPSRVHRVYFDWNATTPPLAAAIDAMARAARETWGNPSSVHGVGRAARSIVEDARAVIAELMACDARDVVLTSGGTEANNLALRSAFAADTKTPRVLVTSRLEHPSITRVAEALEREGRAVVRWLSVTPEGCVDRDDLKAALVAGARLVAVQEVNHETGVVQPIEDVIALVHAHGARVHVDCVQSVGRVVSRASGADSRAIAAHKIRGPKGIGALVTRAGMRVFPVLLGGSQERGVRPGTVDPVAAAGFAVAARAALDAPQRYARIAELRDAIERGALARAPGAQVNGAGTRVPHVTNLALPGWAGPELVAALDLEGVAVSSGSACSAGTAEPSPVLTAMVGAERAYASVRISLGEATSCEDADVALAALARVVGRSSRDA